jgi:hypothetical protein
MLLAGCSGSTTNDATVPEDGPVAEGPPPGDGPRPDAPRKEGGSRDLYPAHYITFNESLCPGIANGTKKSTLRNKHVTYVAVGEWVRLICSTSKTTFKALVTVVRHTTWGEITEEEYKADGFSSQAQMMQTMQTYYPGITLTDPATVIRWDNTSPYP